MKIEETTYDKLNVGDVWAYPGGGLQILWHDPEPGNTAHVARIVCPEVRGMIPNYDESRK